MNARTAPSRRFILLAILMQGGLLAVPSAEEEAPLTRVDPELDWFKNGRTEYFGMYFMDNKVGWMKIRTALDRYEGEEAYSVAMTTRFVIEMDGEKLEDESNDVEYFSTAPPHPFVGGEIVSDNGLFRTRQWTKGGPGNFTIITETEESKRSREAGKIDYTLGDFAAPEIWTMGELEKGDAIRVREFDWDHSKTEIGSYEIIKVFPEKPETPKEARYEIECTYPSSGVSAVMTVDHKGRVLHGSMQGALTLKRESRKKAQQMEKEAPDIFASTLVRVEGEISSPETIAELVLEVAGTGSGILESGPMQTVVKTDDPNVSLVSIGPRHGIRENVTPEARREALLSTATCPSDDPAIRKLALHATGGTESTRAQVKRLVDFVDIFLHDDYQAEPPTVFDVIESRLGDCTEHAQLFITLSRSLGIPARHVSGFVYADEFEAFGGHAWAEVEIDGSWHPVDPTWGETTINGTHIRLHGGKEALNDTSSVTKEFNFRIVDLKRRGELPNLLVLPSRILSGIRAETAELEKAEH